MPGAGISLRPGTVTQATLVRKCAAQHQMVQGPFFLSRGGVWCGDCALDGWPATGDKVKERERIGKRRP